MSLPCQSGLRPCGKKSNRLWEQGQKRFFMFTELQSEREMNVFVLTAQLGAHCVAFRKQPGRAVSSPRRAEGGGCLKMLQK